MKLTRTATTGLAALALISCGHGDRLTKSGLAEAETPAEVAAALGMGWNLGNQLDARKTGGHCLATPCGTTQRLTDAYSQNCQKPALKPSEYRLHGSTRWVPPPNIR